MVRIDSVMIGLVLFVCAGQSRRGTAACVGVWPGCVGLGSHGKALFGSVWPVGLWNGQVGKGSLGLDRLVTSWKGRAGSGVAVMERHAQDGNCMVCSGSPGVYGYVMARRGLARRGKAVGERTGLSGYGTVGMVVATIGSHGESCQGDAWTVWAVMDCPVSSASGRDRQDSQGGAGQGKARNVKEVSA